MYGFNCIIVLHTIMILKPYNCDDIICLTYKLCAKLYFAAFNVVYAKYLTENLARTCIAVKEFLIGILCEVEAVVYLGK